MVFPMKETRAGTVVSVIISLLSMATLSVCLSRRVQNVRNWSKLPLVCWLILIIYADSILFVSGTAIISQGFGVDSSASICSTALLLCLSCYLTTKFIYYFLVERVYIIRRKSNSRLKDKLYLFNSFGMLVPYLVVIALNFYFRFADYEKDSCRIGMKRVAMIPLIAFDVLVNVYLTSLFLIPLRSLYSYRTNRSSQTRTVALRTFVGSCCTLISSVVNLTVVMVLKGEPGWICLMCCNIDILFSVLVLHWITSKDNASTLSQTPNFQPTSDPTSPVRLVPRPPISDMEAYHMGLRDLSRKSGVTTMVTAKDYDDLELERINSMPPNVVTIETEHTMEVSEVRPDTEGSGSDLGMQRVRVIGSKEELFGKENC
ncbi:hypothetical protein BKA61DRAFT_689243 [Leptodontidium sp. MPI-SDFR-AT-0119]|nr:hypothetical protein BKA61DRAFT_689243 [Leptodontidium sp. MPI-SDFR-AT-0119]